jgi:RND family efflux transporter MFP subunit
MIRSGCWLLALGALWGCGGEAAGTAFAEEAIPIAPEDVHRVAREDLQTGPRIVGSLLPRVRADLRAQVPGSVVSVHAEIGQPVEKGEILARIEDRSQRSGASAAKAAVRSARHDARLARREARRTEELVKAGALARRDLEAAQSAAAGARARLSEAEARQEQAVDQLSDATVRAPIDGVVSQVEIHQGDVVNPGAPLFTIIDPTSMRLEASVASQDVPAITVGIPVSFAVRGYGDLRFFGLITRVAPAADEATRQIPILVDIHNTTGKLIAGLFAEGRLASARRTGLVVPLAAVDSSGEGSTVTRVAGDLVERTPVQLGARDEAAELVEVVSGLQEGDVVLLRGARALPPGSKVAVPAIPPRPPRAPAAQSVSPAAAAAALAAAAAAEAARNIEAEEPRKRKSRESRRSKRARSRPSR